MKKLFILLLLLLWVGSAEASGLNLSLRMQNQYRYQKPPRDSCLVDEELGQILVESSEIIYIGSNPYMSDQAFSNILDEAEVAFCDASDMRAVDEVASYIIDEDDSAIY